MQYIDSFGWSLNIILMICFVIALLALMRKPREYRKNTKKKMWSTVLKQTGARVEDPPTNLVAFSYWTNEAGLLKKEYKLLMSHLTNIAS